MKRRTLLAAVLGAALTAPAAQAVVPLGAAYQDLRKAAEGCEAFAAWKAPVGIWHRCRWMGTPTRIDLMAFVALLADVPPVPLGYPPHCSQIGICGGVWPRGTRATGQPDARTVSNFTGAAQSPRGVGTAPDRIGHPQVRRGSTP